MRFEKSADTKILESVLAEASVGQLITYEELSKSIGRDVRAHASSSLRSARRGLQKEKQFVFGCEQNEGLRRLADSDIVASTESDRRRVQRASKRALDKLTCVDFETLDEDAQRAHTTMSAQLGAIQLFSTKNSSKRIEKAVNGSKEVLAIGETLSLFTK